MDKRRVIIDTDPNLRITGRDIDDALALLFMLASPAAALEGVTVIFGNVPARTGFEAAKEVLGMAGSPAPLFRGAESAVDLGRENDAVRFMIETVRNNPGEISLLALGPLTNVATAAMRDGDFLANLKELVIMGGAFRFAYFGFLGEFNFKCDPRAAAIVTAAEREMTLITMDLCSRAVVTSREMKMLEERKSAMTQFLLPLITPWYRINRRKTMLFPKSGFFPWDVVAAACLEDPSLHESNTVSFSVRESGFRSGSLYNIRPGGINTPKELKEALFMTRMMERLLGY